MNITKEDETAQEVMNGVRKSFKYGSHQRKIEKEKREKEVQKNLQNPITISGYHSETDAWIERYLEKLTDKVVICLKIDKRMNILLLKNNLYGISSQNYEREIKLNEDDIIYRFTFNEEISESKYGNLKFTELSKKINEFLKENHSLLSI